MNIRNISILFVEIFFDRFFICCKSDHQISWAQTQTQTEIVERLENRSQTCVLCNCASIRFAHALVFVDISCSVIFLAQLWHRRQPKNSFCRLKGLTHYEEFCKIKWRLIISTLRKHSKAMDWTLNIPHPRWYWPICFDESKCARKQLLAVKTWSIYFLNVQPVRRHWNGIVKQRRRFRCAPSFQIKIKNLIAINLLIGAIM